MLKSVTEFVDECQANVKQAGCTCLPVVTLGSPVTTTTGSVVARIAVEHDGDCVLRIRYERVAKAGMN